MQNIISKNVQNKIWAFIIKWRFNLILLNFEGFLQFFH